MEMPSADVKPQTSPEPVLMRNEGFFFLFARDSNKYSIRMTGAFHFHQNLEFGR